MDIITVINTITKNIEKIVVAAVLSLKEHMPTVKLQSNDVKVTNMPKVQKVAGSVSVQNQKKLETLIRTLTTKVEAIDKSFKALQIPKEMKVNNLKDIVIPEMPKHPTIMEVTNPQYKEMVSQMKDMYKCLEDVKKTLKTLPTKYPDVKIPEFPKKMAIDFPPWPEQKEFPKEMEFKNPTGFWEAAVEFFKKDPKKYINARLVNGKDFIEPLQHIMGSISLWKSLDGGTSRANLNSQSEVLTEVVEFQLNDTDKATSKRTYLGNEDKHGRWQIQRVEKSGKLISMRYATAKNNPDHAESDYSTAWGARTSLVFDRYQVAYQP